MKIEAVIVCINYSDFLKVTLPANKNFFDKVVVVTDTKDTDTKNVCEFYNVTCIQTDEFYKDGPIANKAIGINVGLNSLSLDGWVLQLDADIWLPPLTKDILQRYPLDGKCVYGIDRMMCNSYKEWINFIHIEHKPLHEGWIYLHMHHFPIGQRIVQYNSDGYMPIGFFQLWNPIESGVKSYPILSVGYDRTDVLHLKQFERQYRRFIPDLVCIHLASEKHEMGQNWNSRVTKKFGPSKSQSFKQKLFGVVKYHINKLKFKKKSY